MTMPAWSLVAAGHIPDTDPGAAPALREKLAMVLADPRYRTGLSELRVDGDQPVRAELHKG